MPKLSIDKLSLGRFRGVPFECRSHQVRAGRRVAGHRFPFRESGYQEDLGREDREFTLEAYLVGDDVDRQRERLLAALETPGPGELVHPWLGTLWVVAKPGSISEKRATRRLVELQLTFTEAGEPSQPSLRLPGRATAAAALQVLEEAAGIILTERLYSRGLPGFVKEDTARQIEAIAVAAELSLGVMPPLPETVSRRERGAQLAIAGRRIDRLFGAATRLAGEPADLPLLLRPVLAALGGLAGRDPRGIAAIEHGFRAYGLGQPPIAPTTVNRRRQAERRDWIGLGTRMMALSTGFTLAGRVRPRTYAEAVALRSRLADWADEERRVASRLRDDAAWAAIGSAETSALDILSGFGGTLAPVRSVRLARPQPSLVVAYREFGNARRAQDLVARNGIIHPGFCPVDRTLDLVDGTGEVSGAQLRGDWA